MEINDNKLIRDLNRLKNKRLNNEEKNFKKKIFSKKIKPSKKILKLVDNFMLNDESKIIEYFTIYNGKIKYLLYKDKKKIVYKLCVIEYKLCYFEKINRFSFF